MNKPKALKQGDTVGIIAPSGPVRNPANINKALFYVEQMGYRVKEGKSIRKAYGFLAGPDEERVQDIHTMFADDSVDGVFCLKGGYGTPRIGNKIDRDIIRNNPKVFVGYSDVTTLHIIFNQEADLVTFHGPMPASDMIFNYLPFSDRSFKKAVTEQSVWGEIENPEGCALSSLGGGKVTAPIVGGNLSLIALTMGTPYEIDTKGKILFIEDIRSEPFQVDGHLSQLNNAGKLADCAGFIIGNFNDPTPYTTNPSLSLEQVIDDLIVPTGKPVLTNFMAGHCEPKVTFPLGIPVTLDADNQKMILEEPCCL